YSTYDLSHALERQLYKRIGCGFGVKKYRHLSVGLVNKFFSSKPLYAALLTSGLEADDEDEMHVLHLQAAHSSKTASDIYAKTGNFFGLTEAKFEDFQRASHAWHAFWFGSDGSDVAEGSAGSKRPLAENS